MQFGANMDGLWLSEEALPGFRETSLRFMRRAQGVSEMLMRCFARGLGFEEEYFVRAHDVSRKESQTVLRLVSLVLSSSFRCPSPILSFILHLVSRVTTDANTDDNNNNNSFITSKSTSPPLSQMDTTEPALT